MLSFAGTANAMRAANRFNYRLTTTPNARGRVTNVGVRRVLYNPTDNVVSIFPSRRLLIGNPEKTYGLPFLVS